VFTSGPFSGGAAYFTEEPHYVADGKRRANFDANRLGGLLSN